SAARPPGRVSPAGTLIDIAPAHVLSPVSPVTFCRTAGHQIPDTTCRHVIPSARAGRPSGGCLPRIGPGEVGVPVNEVPLAVDALVDVGDPEGHVTPRPAVDADMTALEAGRIGEISAGGDDEVLQVHCAVAGEPASVP